MKRLKKLMLLLLLLPMLLTALGFGIATANENAGEASGFLNIAGVNGGSNAPYHQNQFEMLGYELGANRVDGTMMQYLRFTRQANAQAGKLSTGDSFKQITLSLKSEVSSQLPEFIKVTLQDAKVVALSQNSESGTEVVTIVFNKMFMDYQAYDEEKPRVPGSH